MSKTEEAPMTTLQRIDAALARRHRLILSDLPIEQTKLLYQEMKQCQLDTPSA